MKRSAEVSEQVDDARKCLRQAGRLEQWFNWRSRMNLNAYITTTARYVNATGSSLSKAVLFGALERAIHKLPALAARVLPPSSRPSPPMWVALPVVDLNRVVTFLDKDLHNLPTVLEEIFVRPMEFPEDMPLWRLLVLRDGTVIFACDHILGDGQSGPAFHHVLLTALNTSPDLNPEHTGLVSLVTQDCTLPPPIEDIINVSPTLRLVLREVPKAIFPFLPVNSSIWTGHPIVKEITLETTVRIFHYTAQDVSALLALSRAHKTTLTGMLHTLALVIIARLLRARFTAAKTKGQKFKTIPTCIPISLRKYTGTPPTTLCNHVSFRETPHSLPRSPPSVISIDNFPWDIAAELTATLKREAPHSQSNLGLLKFLNGKYDKYFLGLLGQTRACGLELSNLGAFPSVPASTGEGEGAWRIEETLFCQADATLGAALKLNVCGTGAGGLGVTITWGKGAVDDSFAKEFVRAFEEDMRVLIGHSSWSAA